MTPFPLFRVETGGLLTTVQDGGRVGHQRAGVPVSGAMDTFAASVANLLLGNVRGDAVLEITLLGPVLLALADTRIALCGADLSARVDGEPVALWWTSPLKTGQRLSFGRRRAGARAYLAVPGGFAVPRVLGSRSTLLRAGLGGYSGRRLQAGDVLEGLDALPFGERGLRPNDIPTYPLPARLSILPGPHSSAFTATGWETLLSSEYTLTPQSDRMGYRLDGPMIERTGDGEILSEAMPFGGLQVPPDGRPILLMADRQTTGGYPLIGTVISADLPRAGQLAPGDTVRFGPVALEEAHERAIREERWLRMVGGC